MALSGYRGWTQKQVRSNLARCLVTLGVWFLGATVWICPSAVAAPDLYVGNFFGPGNEDVLRYNGSTGAFLSTFVPTGSGGLTFPLWGAFGPDGNLYVSNSEADAVLRFVP